MVNEASAAGSCMALAAVGALTMPPTGLQPVRLLTPQRGAIYRQERVFVKVVRVT